MTDDRDTVQPMGEGGVTNPQHSAAQPPSEPPQPHYSPSLPSPMHSETTMLTQEQSIHTMDIRPSIRTLRIVRELYYKALATLSSNPYDHPNAVVELVTALPQLMGECEQMLDALKQKPAIEARSPMSLDAMRQAANRKAKEGGDDDDGA